MSKIEQANVFVSSVNKEMPYSQFVDSLFKRQGYDMEMLHAALGVAGEAGELGDAIKKHIIYGKDLDRKNVVEELGDLRFYMQAMMILLNITEEEVLVHNVEKLQARYKKLSYSNEAAIARADKVEFAAQDYDDYVKVANHIYHSASAGGYVFSDEASQYVETLYPTQEAAQSALEDYIKSLG